MWEDPRGLSLEPDRCSRHSIGIHASPAEVFRALTDPEELSRWFVSEASIDLRAGGAYRLVFGEAPDAPENDPEVVSGEFASVVQQKLLQMRARIGPIETDLEFRLEPWRDGTMLTVSHSGFPGEQDWDETFHAIDRSWESELPVLKLYLERAHGMSRRSRFHEILISASAEEIFERFASATGLESWLADRATIDPEPGGELRLEWDKRSAIVGHLAVWDPDRFLVMTWEEKHPSLIRIWLGEEKPAQGDEPGVIELGLEHRLFAPDPKKFSFFDWDAALERLARSIRSKPDR